MRIDFDAHYAVEGYGGIAWGLLGFAYSENDAEQYEWSGIHEYDLTQVRAVMVGDDRVFVIDVDDLEQIGEDKFCGTCGQIGCGHG